MPTSSTLRPPNPEPDSVPAAGEGGDSGAPELVETGGGRNLRYRGRLLYSERGPASCADRLALAALGSAERGPARLYLLASPCLWHGVGTFLAGLGEDSALLCLEAEPALAAIARASFPPELAGDPRLIFSESLDPAVLLSLASRVGSFRRVILLRFSGGAAFHEAAYRRMCERLDAELIAEWRNRPTLMALGRRWIGNIFSNLAFLGDIAPRPIPRPRKPILVCGAGPSLESALPLLERARDRLFLLACDTALPALYAAGFLPDLGVCLEGQAHNLADFIPVGAQELPLLADLSSHPASFRSIRGPKHLSLVRIKEGAFSRRLGSLGLPAISMPPLGSVGVHALHLARFIASAQGSGAGSSSAGSSSVPLLFTGLDFAFEAGKTHARGSPALLGEELAMSRFRRWSRQYGSTFRGGVHPAPEAAPRGQSWQAGGQSSHTGGQSPQAGGQSWPATLLTDPALLGYAALLGDEIRLPGPPVYDLRGRGLPLGATEIDLSGALSLLEALSPIEPEFPNYPLPRGQALRPGEGEDLSRLGLAFLMAERARLEALEAALRGRAAPPPEGLVAAIRNLDYLLWPAPDAERIIGLPQDLLNRVLVETEHWLWKLGELLSPG